MKWSILVLVAWSLGCQQRMAEQPSCRPLVVSEFFADGRSARPLVAGVIARGQLRDEKPLFTSRAAPASQVATGASLVGFALQSPLAAFTATQVAFRQVALAEYTDTLPMPLTMELLHRGRERFNIYCIVCHGPTGQGNGKIVERGYTKPPSYLTDNARGFALRGIPVRLRDVPVGYFFEVISRGFGAMPDYATQVPPRDRWAIAAYIRSLQLSQYTRLDDLPLAERDRLRRSLEEAP